VSSSLLQPVGFRSPVLGLWRRHREPRTISFCAGCLSGFVSGLRFSLLPSSTRFFDSCSSQLPGSMRRLAHVRPPAQTPAQLPLCRFFLGQQRAKSQSWSLSLVVSIELLPSPSSVSVSCWSALVAWSSGFRFQNWVLAV
jgi:hypothetical protein